MDERTRELADAIARTEAKGDAHGASRPSARRPLFDAQAEMSEARAQTYLHLVEDRKHLTETIRLHEETGKVYSIQPNGNFEMDARGLAQHGGAEAFMQNVRQRLERTHTAITEAAAAIAGSSSTT